MVENPALAGRIVGTKTVARALDDSKLDIVFGGAKRCVELPRLCKGNIASQSPSTIWNGGTPGPTGATGLAALRLSAPQAPSPRQPR